MKQMLMIRACGVESEKSECNSFKSQAELYQIAVDDVCPKTNEDIFKALNSGVEYDFIYLSTHGGSDGFGNEDETVDMTWMEFGSALCEAQCMSEDCVVFLSCCRGGLNQVAYDLFYCCGKIAYIVGPRQSLVSTDMLISFNILLYNIVQRNIDPIVACDKVKLATDIRFVCFDRMETEGELAFFEHIKKYSKVEIVGAHEAKRMAREELQWTPPEVTALLKQKLVKLCS